MKILTKTQKQWLNHVRACAELNISLSEYERKHDLSNNSLCRWRSKFRKWDLLGNHTETSKAYSSVRFQKIQIQANSPLEKSAFRIDCGHSVKLEFESWPGKEILSEVLSLLIIL
jgi:hypothetical protein